MEGFQLKNLPDLPDLSDFDYFAVQDVSNVLVPLSRFSVAALRANFGQLPPTSELPEGAIDLPAWRLERFAGGWRIYIDTIVEDARYYLLYYYSPESGEYVAINYIPEFRLDAAAGPLTMTIMAPDHSPPREDYRVFKVQTITEDYKSPLSGAKDAWTELYLPPEFTPAAPSLETLGYPIVSLAPMPDGGFGYTVTLKIRAATGEKDYVRYYELQRATDGGVDPFPSDAKYVRLPDHPIDTHPAPPGFIYNNSDRALQPGNRYRYRVRAIAQNGVPSAWSNYQELTLTDDTTAPDTPVFAVTEVTLGLRVEFNKPTQSGQPCVDWKAWRLQVKKDGGTWEYIGSEDGFFPGMYYQHDIDNQDMASSYEFRAKAVDFAGNESAWTGVSSGNTANKVGGEAIDDRTVQAKHVALKALTYQEIADLTLKAANIGDLEIKETKIDNDAVTTPKIKANNVIGSHIQFGTMEGGHFKALTITGDKVATNTLSLSKLNFTPLTSAGQTGEIIATILASSEGIRITGNKLAIDSNTTFAADVEIQGILKSTGGIKTGSGNDRIEIGKYGSTDQIKFFTGGAESGWFRNDGGELTMKMFSGADYHYITRHGFGIYKSSIYYALLETGSYSRLYLNDGSNSIQINTGELSLKPYLAINGTRVVQEQQAAIANPAVTTAANNTAIIAILAALRTHGLIDT